jgi:ribosomal-protein-alanine N-acetyltransferase
VLPAGYEIRALSKADAPALAAAYRRNRDHLEPW